MQIGVVQQREISTWKWIVGHKRGGICAFSADRSEAHGVLFARPWASEQKDPGRKQRSYGNVLRMKWSGSVTWTTEVACKHQVKRRSSWRLRKNEKKRVDCISRLASPWMRGPIRGNASRPSALIFGLVAAQWADRISHALMHWRRRLH